MKHNLFGGHLDAFVIDHASDHVAFLLLLLPLMIVVFASAAVCSGVSNMQEVQAITNCISLGTGHRAPGMGQHIKAAWRLGQLWLTWQNLTDLIHREIERESERDRERGGCSTSNCHANTNYHLSVMPLRIMCLCIIKCQRLIL